MKTVEQRFNEKWMPEPYTGCWIWMGAANREGYGNLKIGDKWTRAHRLSYTLHRGTIPTGLHVLHHCDTPSCVNPAHLFIGTDSDNLRDAFHKGRRNQNGTRNHKCKISEHTVRLIREASGTLRQIATQFGLSHSHISDIRLERKWKCVF